MHSFTEHQSLAAVTDCYKCEAVTAIWLTYDQYQGSRHAHPSHHGSQEEKDRASVSFPAAKLESTLKQNYQQVSEANVECKAGQFSHRKAERRRGNIVRPVELA